MGISAFGLDLAHDLLWTADHVLDAEECRAYVERIEAAPREVAPISGPGGPVVAMQLRNNTRVMFDDPDGAAALWPRVRALVPPRLGGGDAVGLNERFRAYRYDIGERFGPHYDGAFRRDAAEVSRLTVILYLNQGFGGGETNFLDLHRSVVPRAGRALFFQHCLLHEGAPVTAGVKYVLRTDVMYRDGP